MDIGSHKVDQRGSGDSVADRSPRLAAASFLARLPQLLDELRKLGFSIGVDQHIAVNELLIGLAARKAFPLQDQTVFGRLLCPLFAKSPLQQEIFAAFFEDWLQRLPTTEPKIDDGFHLWLSQAEKARSGLQGRTSDGPTDPKLRDRKDVRILLFRWDPYLRWLIVSLVAIGFLVGAIWGINRFHYFGSIFPPSQQESGSKAQPPWAGVGKSTLVNHWLRRMAADHYRSAQLVFGWSFYRQGTSGGTS
jgi:hypothetical protein